jgi:hypothetical protein
MNLFRWLWRPARVPARTDPPIPEGWTADMSISLAPHHSIEDVVDFILRAEVRHVGSESITGELTTRFGLSDEDAALAWDRTLGGLTRAATGNPANCPVRDKDPVAWASYQRCSDDPALIAAIRPQYEAGGTSFDSLQHAYGLADDIPVLLERARNAPAPETYRDEPWFSLWSSLCHQGDVYTASYAAVPELIEIAVARAAETRVAWACLRLAGTIELERALPEGAAPPAIPPDLAREYAAALHRGAELASRQLAGTSDRELQRGFAISYAAFRGDVAEARRLTNDAEDAENTE